MAFRSNGRKLSERNMQIDVNKLPTPKVGHGHTRLASIQKLRVLTRNVLQQQQYQNAIFYADKLVSMSRGCK